MAEPVAIVKLDELVGWLEVGLDRVCFPQVGLKPSAPSFGVVAL